MEFFAANRRGFVTGEPWGLTKANPFPSASHGYLKSGRGDFTADDIANHVSALYPDGMSPHGWHYCTVVFGVLTLSGSTVLPNEPTMEFIFEYVRRAAYPDRISRLQAFFGYDNIDQARKQYPEHPLVTFQSEQFFRCDQRWLNVSYQVAVAEFNAHRYWSGDSTTDPVWEYLVRPPFTPQPVT